MARWIENDRHDFGIDQRVVIGWLVGVGWGDNYYDTGKSVTIVLTEWLVGMLAANNSLLPCLHTCSVTVCTGNWLFSYCKTEMNGETSRYMAHVCAWCVNQYIYISSGWEIDRCESGKTERNEYGNGKGAQALGLPACLRAESSVTISYLVFLPAGKLLILAGAHSVHYPYFGKHRPVCKSESNHQDGNS